jgi:hypothetical protein
LTRQAQSDVLDMFRFPAYWAESYCRPSQERSSSGSGWSDNAYCSSFLNDTYVHIYIIKTISHTSTVTNIAICLHYYPPCGCQQTGHACMSATKRPLRWLTLKTANFTYSHCGPRFRSQHFSPVTFGSFTQGVH